MLNRSALCVMTVVMLSGVAASSIGSETAKPASSAEELQLPERKQTTLGLYVTAAQAYEMWKASPDKVKIIDVRTPEEFAFVGHPEMAFNIPFALVTYQRKDGKTAYAVKMNADFVAEVQKVAGPTDTLLVTCRSGDRSARAVDVLAAAGFTNAYTIVDGVEGDKVEDPGSVFNGKRIRNGWKNSAPWVYTLDPEKFILEKADSRPKE